MGIIAKYRRKQFFILTVVFLMCSSIIFIVEYLKEKNILIDKLDKELSNYAGLINNFLQEYNFDVKNSNAEIDTFVKIIPDKNLRITIIDFSGLVIYDSRVKNTSSMENHINRPEIKMAAISEFGSDIRISATNNVKYYYFARKYNKQYIRISIEYNLATAELFEPEKLSILIILLIFFITTIVVVFVADKFGTSMNMLKEFTMQVASNQSVENSMVFPKNELGAIGQDIVEIYEKLNKAKSDLLSEKEKLIRHLDMLDEGIAIFTAGKKIMANNSFFIQYLSLIGDNNVLSAETFFDIKIFTPLSVFIEKQMEFEKNAIKQSFHEITISKDSRIFSAKCIVFQDRSIEVIITDITKPAKRKLIKQQLTDNIAHELKTPVSSIKGFLETIIDVQPEKEKLYYFIKKAYSQTCRLTDLIDDIGMLTKIEEAANLYQIERIDLLSIVKNVIDDVDIQLKENQIKLILDIPESIELDGNSILMYSIFRNLFDNTLNYAGKELCIKVEKYFEDENYYYISFSDNGIGVPEQDLTRLFERFYRVDKGREHKKGGTGLGLAIVKNAVLFHKGEISAKNRIEGGLEFLFSLKKSLN